MMFFAFCLYFSVFLLSGCSVKNVIYNLIASVTMLDLNCSFEWRFSLLSFCLLLKWFFWFRCLFLCRTPYTPVCWEFPFFDDRFIWEVRLVIMFFFLNGISKWMLFFNFWEDGSAFVFSWPLAVLLLVSESYRWFSS